MVDIKQQLYQKRKKNHTLNLIFIDTNILINAYIEFKYNNFRKTLTNKKYQDCVLPSYKILKLWNPKFVYISPFIISEFIDKASNDFSLTKREINNLLIEIQQDCINCPSYKFEFFGSLKKKLSYDNMLSLHSLDVEGETVLSTITNPDRIQVCYNYYINGKMSKSTNYHSLTAPDIKSINHITITSPYFEYELFSKFHELKRKYGINFKDTFMIHILEFEKIPFFVTNDLPLIKRMKKMKQKFIAITSQDLVTRFKTQLSCSKIKP